MRRNAGVRPKKTLPTFTGRQGGDDNLKCHCKLVAILYGLPHEGQGLNSTYTPLPILSIRSFLDSDDIIIFFHVAKFFRKDISFSVTKER